MTQQLVLIQLKELEGILKYKEEWSELETVSHREERK